MNSFIGKHGRVALAGKQTTIIAVGIAVKTYIYK